MTKIKVRIGLFPIAALLLAMPAVAQNSPAPDPTFQSGAGYGAKVTITVTVDGLSCTTSAGSGAFSAQVWSFGGTQTSTGSGSGSGAGAGKASLSSLNITKNADACSPALFEALVTGKAFKSLTVVQSSNKEEVFTVTLSEVFISSYQLVGDLMHDLPTEQLSFTFAKIMFTDPQSGAKSSWNTTTNTSF
ncbi:MAG: type VI secretion system tube protein Hcp [Candidatus Sulfotelmatobacter sp.]|jgi:type VI secretion system Hcp family effector